ncbi:MAG: tetratricopeptide repeat protein [Methylothermaceae bacterium]|nr:tetratricopeptide repeat protein [Methylothermaceae bacterium]
MTIHFQRIAHAPPPGRELTEGMFLWALLTVAYFLYAPALAAPWQFDDPVNLQGLAGVRDFGTATDFVFAGIASELGRPLSLATFLLNAPAWPHDPAPFRHVNILIHLLNGVLVAWLGLRVSRLQPRARDFGTWPALMLTSIWLLHPFLASTSLMVVQRMTLVAATLTLLGLLAFVHGRSLLAHSPRAAYAWMSGGLTLGAGLGVLAKENAALLPFFALVLSVTVLAHLPAGNRRAWHAWQALFFGGPAVLLFVYIIHHWPSLSHGYLARPFSMGERLMSEPVILWQYVRQLLVPNIVAMGPFQDDTAIRTHMSISVILAILAWIGTVAAALFWRRRAPWFSLAVLWFLAGHVLESTIFNLELYFEHRNYLPALGPLAALVALAWSRPSRWPRLAATAAVFAAAALLWQVTTLWGQPMLSAERWAAAHPASSRATQFLAQRYVLIGDEKTALRVLERGRDAAPQASDLALQTLQLGCGLMTEADFRAELEQTLAAASSYRASLATPKATNALRIQLNDGACPGLDQKGLTALIAALLRNPFIDHHGLIKHHLHHQLAEIYTDQGYLDGAVRNLQAAFESRPNPQTAQLLAITFASAGLYEEAIASLDHAMSRAPNFGLAHRKWETLLKPFRNQLVQYTKSVHHAPTAERRTDPAHS